LQRHPAQIVSEAKHAKSRAAAADGFAFICSAGLPALLLGGHLAGVFAVGTIAGVTLRP